MLQHDVVDRSAFYEDPVAGIRERFLTPEIGGGRTVAVLSEPLHQRVSHGWVVCHSFGLEQENLQSFEAHLARRLAMAGCPALRFHSQGYGDSELSLDHMGLETHIQDAVDATALMGTLDVAADVGLIGARFGGAVAALAASRTDVRAIALIDPVVDGRSYMRSMIRSALASGLTRSSGHPQQEDPLTRMEREGSADVHGFSIRREVFEEICSLDLVGDLTDFRGRSLVVQVSRSASQRKDLQRLVQRLADLGGLSRLEVLAHADALRLGLPRLRAVGTSKKEDSLADLTEALTTTSVAWCSANASDPREDLSI